MSNTSPTVSTTDLRSELSEVINRVAFGGERITLERREKPIAVIIPVEEYEFLERIIAEREDAIDSAAVKAAGKDRGKAVPLEQVKRELGLAEPTKRKRSA